MKKGRDQMNKCIGIGFRSLVVGIILSLPVHTSPGLAGQEYILLKNAKIYTMGKNGILDPGMILIKGGKIEKIGTNFDLSSGAQVIDLSGKRIIPGMISAASSLFLAGRDLVFPGDESPDTDILEGLTYFDDTIPEIVKQGVTAAYISPVSFRSVGGLGAVVKLAIKEGGGIEVLKEKAGLRVNVERMENKKTSNLLRLTQYQKIRDLFIQAKDYRKEWQDYERKLAEYQEAQKSLKDKPSQKEGEEKEKLKEPEKPKKDEGKEIILQVMDKKIPLRVEAHRPDAILNALRLGQEFGIKIILEKGEDWPKVLPQIKENAAGLLSNPLLDYQKYLMPGGIKGYAAGLLKARRDDFFYAGKGMSCESLAKEAGERWESLASAKVPFALIPPDNFPFSVRFLRFYASILMARGFAEEEALKAITSGPAEILGVSERVGSLEEGKDADLVVLEGEPLNSLSKVFLVFINGIKVWESKNEKN